MILRVRNLLDSDAPKTVLGASYATGAGTLGVLNVNAFSANWAIQIGKTGEEEAEIVKLGTAAPSGTNLVLSGTIKYNHSAGAPVYAIKYDQLVFEVSTTGTAGTATAIAAGTVNITPDNEYTQFDHTDGLTTYAYKVKYYNATLADASTESDWIVPSGFSYWSLAKIRERIKRKLVSANYIQKDEVIDDWINEWLEKMTNAAIDVNRDYLLGTTSLTWGAGTELATITASDFKEVRRVWFVSANGTVTATRMTLTDFQPDDTYSEALPYYYMKGDNVMGRNPYDAAGTAVLDYYKMSPVMTNDTDELPVSMRSYTKSFVDYGFAQACFLDQKDEKGYAFMNMANSELAQFKTEIAPRARSGPQYIKILTTIGSDDEFELF